MNTLPAAVLWDMDGTIVDTEPYFTDALTTLVASCGGTLSDTDHHALIGANLWDMAATAIKAGAQRDAHTIVTDVVTAVQQRLRHGIPWRPGALELLQELHTARIPTALVTMSFRPIANAVVSALPFAAFDAIVTGEDVEHGKPAPDAYLRAADLLNADITRCIVIEDSPPGVAAGVAAGARVVAVPFYVSLPDSDAYTRWDTLAGKGLSLLAQAALRPTTS
ncbi:HAD family hydrolase [Streptomyces sp. NPDC091280]|uniref:HAD family hydrolase n=1 Tax=Streptomyces sp. NPDC091280 TaxID=3365984 RepID=UPI00381AEBCD